MAQKSDEVRKKRTHANGLKYQTPPLMGGRRLALESVRIFTFYRTAIVPYVTTYVLMFPR